MTSPREIFMATVTTLFNFDFSNGMHPSGPLVEDAAGDLFGIATNDNYPVTSLIYEIARTSNGYAGAATVLANFTSANASLSGLAIDAAGDLFIPESIATYVN